SLRPALAVACGGAFRRPREGAAAISALAALPLPRPVRSRPGRTMKKPPRGAAAASSLLTPSRWQRTIAPPPSTLSVVLPHIEDLEEVVVAMLHGEEAARLVEVLFRSQQLLLVRAAVGHEYAGRLVVLGAGRRRRQIATEGDEAERPPVQEPLVEGPDRVERLELVVQGVAAIFGGQQLMPVGEGEIVERIVHLVAEHEDRDRPVVLRLAATVVVMALALAVMIVVVVPAQVDTKDRAPCAARRELRHLAGG